MFGILLIKYLRNPKAQKYSENKKTSKSSIDLYTSIIEQRIVLFMKF
jgi:hypothetical protein